MNFEDIIMCSQKQLFKKLTVPGCIYSPGSYILVEGKAPVMLLAHLDTVHKEKVRTICYDKKRNVLMSPQGIGGDDRCGVYALLQVYKRSRVKPWLLFLCDEEIGCLGADQFCKDHEHGVLPKGLDNLKFLIEIDRKGNNDAVYYDCANDEFEDYITSKGFKTDWGSLSDISYVAPELGVAAVNLSSGYYNPHTLSEYIVKSDLERTIQRVIDIVEEADAQPTYEYKERPYHPGAYKFDSYGNYSFGNYSSFTDTEFHSEKSYYNHDSMVKYLKAMGYTEKELNDLETKYGEWALEDTFWEEFDDETYEYVIAGK